MKFLKKLKFHHPKIENYLYTFISFMTPEEVRRRIEETVTVLDENTKETREQIYLSLEPWLQSARENLMKAREEFVAKGNEVVEMLKQRIAEYSSTEEEKE